MERAKAAYTVALHPDEIHRQRHRFIAVLVQCFYVVQEICKELVAPFQDTQSHNVVPPHVLDYVPSKPLRPEPVTHERERKQTERLYLKIRVKELSTECYYWRFYLSSKETYSNGRQGVDDTDLLNKCNVQ